MVLLNPPCSKVGLLLRSVPAGGVGACQKLIRARDEVTGADKHRLWRNPLRFLRIVPLVILGVVPQNYLLCVPE